MSLYTGKEVHVFVWNELPISDDVINRVHELAKKNEKTLYKLINKALIVALYESFNSPSSTFLLCSVSSKIELK